MVQTRSHPRWNGPGEQNPGPRWLLVARPAVRRAPEILRLDLSRNPARQTDHELMGGAVSIVASAERRARVGTPPMVMRGRIVPASSAP